MGECKSYLYRQDNRVLRHVRPNYMTSPEDIGQVDRMIDHHDIYNCHTRQMSMSHHHCMMCHCEHNPTQSLPHTIMTHRYNNNNNNTAISMVHNFNKQVECEVQAVVR